MPVSVSASHVLSATTPDDPLYEIRPSHWNSAHALTASLVISATEISAAFSNANGILFGISNSKLTLSHNGLTSQSAQAFSAAGGESAFQTLIFTNGNGFTFSNSAGSVGASYTVPSVAGLISGVNLTVGTSGASTTNASAFQFSNASGVTWGQAGGVITASVKTDYLTTAALSNHSHGNPTLALTNLSGTTASNSAGFTLSLAAQDTTAALTSQSNQNVLASNGNYNFQTLSFSNANGISFGTSAGSAIVASYTVPTQTAQSLSFVGTGNTTISSTTTVDARSLTLNGMGGMSVGFSNGSILLSAPQTVAQSNQAIGVYASSNTTLTSSGTLDARSLSVRGIGGVTIGFSAGEMLISGAAAGGGGTLSMYAVSNTTQGTSGTAAASALSFAGAGIASVGVTGGTVVVSVPAGGGAGDGFNIVSMLTSTSGGGTAGATFSNSAASIGLMAGSNITLSQTSNTINIVAPNSSSLVATSGLSISTNGSTISIGEIQASFFRQAGQITQAGTLQGNSLVSIQAFQLPRDVVFSNALIAGSFNVATAANNSSAYQDVSISGVVYSRNAATLSSIVSFSNTFTRTWSSNASQTVTGVAGLTASIAQTTLTEGEYWIAWHVSTTNSATGGANTTALTHAISMILSGSLGSAANNAKVWGAQSNATVGIFGGQGFISTGATRATIGLSDVTVTGTMGHLAPIFFEIRNGTYQL